VLAKQREQGGGARTAAVSLEEKRFYDTFKRNLLGKYPDTVTYQDVLDPFTGEPTGRQQKIVTPNPRRAQVFQNIDSIRNEALEMGLTIPESLKDKTVVPEDFTTPEDLANIKDALAPLKQSTDSPLKQAQPQDVEAEIGRLMRDPNFQRLSEDEKIKTIAPLVKAQRNVEKTVGGPRPPEIQQVSQTVQKESEQTGQTSFNSEAEARAAGIQPGQIFILNVNGVPYTAVLE